MSDLTVKLNAIQCKLNAPKGQRNTFGNYNYRSCEDILSAVKPLLSLYESVLTLNDDIVMIGDRIYVKATATISDGTQNINAIAFAREQVSKKGMDEAQITGSASSYARKYALNGLFAIDDTKDADTVAPDDQIKEKPWLDIDRNKKAQDYIKGELAKGTESKVIIDTLSTKYKINRDTRTLIQDGF